MSRRRTGGSSSDSSSGGQGGIRLPESGLAEDILSAFGDGTSSPAAPPPSVLLESPLPSGPERLYALADRLANASHRVVAAAPETPEIWVNVGVGQEIFSLPVEAVEEVLRVGTVTRLPYAPLAVRGITQHRGRVLTVLDLRVRLGLPEIEIGEQSRIAVVTSRGRSLGLLVDAAFQVVKILPSGIQAPPADVMTERSHFIVGVYRSELGLLILLDVDRVLLLDPEADAGEAGEGSGGSKGS